MKRRIAASLVLVLAGVRATAAPPGISPNDRVGLEEALALVQSVGERVWPGWDAAPFDLLLVDGDAEYLAHSSQRPDGFSAVKGATLAGAPVLWRPRQFPPTLLASFPAFSETPTIVVGTPCSTHTTARRWVLSVAHEHFHQLQSSRPGYFTGVEALGLSRGDKTGMWMLNYAFPYEDATIVGEFDSLSRELARLVEGGTREARAAFWCRLRALLVRLEPGDRRYLSFQLWQEGISRYVELKLAEAAAAGHTSSPAFTALASDAPYGALAGELRAKVVASLRDESLRTRQREIFYPFGAALGLLLDTDVADWKARYFREPFALEGYAGGTCPAAAGATGSAERAPTAP